VNAQSPQQSDPRTFIQLLHESRLKKSALAKRLGVQPGTVTIWKENAPTYALAYLRLYIEDERKQEMLNQLMRPTTMPRHGN
jgi:hypothetical protein